MNPLRRTVYMSCQWLQGYDLRVAEETLTSIRLVCATHPCASLRSSMREALRNRCADGLLWLFARDRTCSFDITARKREFGANEGELVAGKTGWSSREPPIDKAAEESDKDYEARLKRSEERIKAEFAARTTHNYAAPYYPLDEATENARRAKLEPGDPTLEKPPLVRVAHGFAGEDDSDDSVEIVPRAGAGFASSVASRATPSAWSADGGSGSNRYNRPYPSPSSSKPHAVYQTGPAAGPATAFQHATHVGAPDAAAAVGSLPLQAHATPLGAMPGQPLSAAAAAPLPFQGAAFASGSGPAYSAVVSAAPVPPPSQSANLSSRNNKPSELQQFLLDIDPAFAKYFQFFDDEVLSLDTSVDRLLALDDGSDSLKTFDLFREIPGLPLFLVAMAADGVRKAKLRQAKNPSGAKLYPKIAIGIQRVEAENWVQGCIKKGQAILDQEAAAAAPAAL